MEKIFKSRALINKPKVVVVTGAESTGKSSLTTALSNHFKVPYIPEFAREYVENLKSPYNYNDVEIIARKQSALLNEIKNTDNTIVFVDTWLIITKVWFEVVFNKIPGWLLKEISDTKIDLFLVCNIDLPWVADSVRENGGENRIFLQKKYIECLNEYNFNYTIVSGENKNRLKNALQFIELLK